MQVLTLKAPITTAADDNHNTFSLFFREKKDLMFQVNPLLCRVFTSKFKPDKSKKLKCRLLQFFVWRFKGLSVYALPSINFHQLEISKQWKPRSDAAICQIADDKILVCKITKKKFTQAISYSEFED